MGNQAGFVVLVLGAGRSGTSLLMQLLLKFGLLPSDAYIKANSANTEGFLEDAEIAVVYDKIFRLLGANAYFPLPSDWTKRLGTANTLEELQHVFSKYTSRYDRIWGFKEPRSSLLLPILLRALNRCRVIVKPILCIRDPSDTFVSFIKNFDEEPALIEIAWLIRNLDALYHLNCSCYIAHYEDWFISPVQNAQGLLYYSGLDKHFNSNLSEVMAETVKPNLNRASLDSYEIQNPFVIKLYAELKKCHGADFDRERLMSVVKECRRAMEGFKGWYLAAQQASKKLRDSESRLASLQDELAIIREDQVAGQQQLRVMQKENNRLRAMSVEIDKLSSLLAGLGG